MRHQQFHILDLLTWTIIIAVLCASYLLAQLIDPPNNRSIRAILRFCVIASVPFAFIISLIRQPIFSSRMWSILSIHRACLQLVRISFIRDANNANQLLPRHGCIGCREHGDDLVTDLQRFNTMLFLKFTFQNWLRFW